MMDNGVNLYTVGGSLTFNHPTYVERQADRDLEAGLRAGQFCYVFNCRQMGKSSLRVRVLHRLQAEGMSCAAVDITSLGSDIDAGQWYNGLITQLFLSFNLAGKINLKVWLRERDHLPPVQKLSQFIETVILAIVPGDKVFILIDEIDKVLSLKFSLDDFFSLIRYCYNQRAEDSRYQRLGFALFGVATPSDLIREKTQTPFNIGTAIALQGFTLKEVKPLAMGLQDLADQPMQVLKAILAWTGGQPFLTQKICRLLRAKNHYLRAGQETPWIDQLVQTEIIHHWESQDEPVHLKTIRDRLLRNEKTTGHLLGLYQHILEKGKIKADDSPEQSELKLSGLVVKNDGHLVVYNPIYQAVFNLNWVQQQLAKIRPYSESILAWEQSQYQDQSRLLRGQALKDALQWSADKNLSSIDYKFLNASQTVEQQEAETANIILSQANQKAQKMMRFGLGILLLSFLAATLAFILAGITYRQQQIAQKGFQLQRLSNSAERQFNFEQINGLLSAMTAGNILKRGINPQESPQNYPTTAPISSLQFILDRIQEKNRLTGHQEGVTTVAFSPQGTVLASGSRDKTIRIWNLKGQLQQILKGHQGSIYRVSFSPDGQTLASASQDGTIKLWNLAGQLLKTLTGHQGSVYAVTFSPDGRYLASASRDKTVRLWTKDGQLLKTLTGAKRSLDDVKFSPDGRLIGAVSRDGKVRIWDSQGQLIREFGQPNLALFGLSFSPDGQTLVTGGEDGNIQLWQMTGQLLRTIKGHQELVTSVLFSADGQQIISASSDGTAKIWTTAGQEITTLRGHQEEVFGLAIAPDGKTLGTTSEDGSLKLWDIAPKTTIGFKPWASKLSGWAINPRQAQIALTTDQSPLMLMDLWGKVMQKFPEKSVGLSRLHYSNEGQWLMGEAGGGEIQIWSKEGKLLQQIQTDLGRIYDIALSPDRQSLVATNRLGQVGLWQWQNEQFVEQKTIQASQDRIRSIAFHPHNGGFATSSEDGTVKLWQRDGRLRQAWEAHKTAINQVLFSPQGDFLLTASRDGTAKLWSLTGELKQTFQTDPLPVAPVSFSPDHPWLAIASNDGSIHLWDLAGNLRGEFKGEEVAIDALGFTPQGQDLVTINRQGRVRIWAIQSEFTRLNQLLTQGCQWLADYFLSNPKESLKYRFCTDQKAGQKSDNETLSPPRF